MVTGPSAPGFVPDFVGGTSAQMVLDWREQAAHQVVVQIPMRTALARFAQIEHAASASSSRKSVDTEA